MNDKQEADRISFARVELVTHSGEVITLNLHSVTLVTVKRETHVHGQAAGVVVRRITDNVELVIQGKDGGGVT